MASNTRSKSTASDLGDSQGATSPPQGGHGDILEPPSAPSHGGTSTSPPQGGHGDTPEPPPDASIGGNSAASLGGNLTSPPHGGHGDNHTSTNVTSTMAASSPVQVVNLNTTLSPVAASYQSLRVVHLSCYLVLGLLLW